LLTKTYTLIKNTLISGELWFIIFITVTDKFKILSVFAQNN